MTWAIGNKGYSQRRACGLVGLHPKTYRYASKRSGDEELRKRLRELASQRRRFGCRRLGLMLERQGIKLNRKKLYRLYKEERLTVRKRGGRKRALGTRAPMAVPRGRNLRWSLDFPTKGKTGTDSPYERGQVGEQVTDAASTGLVSMSQSSNQFIRGLTGFWIDDGYVNIYIRPVPIVRRKAGVTGAPRSASKLVPVTRL